MIPWLDIFFPLLVIAVSAYNFVLIGRLRKADHCCKRANCRNQRRPYHRPIPKVEPNQGTGDIGCPVAMHVEGGERG